MVVAVAYAVFAALCWGVADFAVARLGDRTTTLATFAHAQVGGLGAIVAFAAVVGVARPPAAASPPSWRSDWRASSPPSCSTSRSRSAR